MTMPDKVLDLKEKDDSLASKAQSLGISVTVMAKASNADLSLLEATKKEAWGMGIGQWVEDNKGRYDPTLLGSFMYVMRKRNQHAARAQDFLAAFLKWRDEIPSAE